MSDDEAFIRGLVNRRGDDLPRLVYADWLDERGDPRGTYLRTEIEWAKPWRDGTPPGWSPRIPGHDVLEWEEADWKGMDGMLAAARGLDPVWVARVSRPPIGVCCDHLRFRNSGPALSLADLAAGEARLGCRLPPALAGFLLNYNGGEPSPGQFVFRCGNDDDGWTWDWAVVDEFGCLLPAADAGGRPSVPRAESLESLRAELADYQESEDGFGEDDVPGNYLSVGRHSGGTCVLLVRLGGESVGAVFDVSLEGENAVPNPLVPSLPQLLGRIVTGPI